MPNHKKTRANMVPNGTAPEDFSPQIKAFRTKKMAKQIPGNMKAVLRVIYIFFPFPKLGERLQGLWLERIIVYK